MKKATARTSSGIFVRRCHRSRREPLGVFAVVMAGR